MQKTNIIFEIHNIGYAKNFSFEFEKESCFRTRAVKRENPVTITKEYLLIIYNTRFE